MSTPAYQCLRVPSSCLIISSQTMEKWKHKRFFHRMNNSNHQGHSQSKGFHADTRTTSAEEKTINMSDTETASGTESISVGGKRSRVGRKPINSLNDVSTNGRVAGARPVCDAIFWMVFLASAVIMTLLGNQGDSQIRTEGAFYFKYRDK